MKIDDRLERLGIKQIVNAQGYYSSVGGGMMTPTTVQAFCEMSRHYVDLAVLHERVNQEVASLTKNEAAVVTCGATAALLLSMAASRERLMESGRLGPTDPKNFEAEVIVHRAHRTPLDKVLAQSRIKFLEIGNAIETSMEDLREAFSAQTCAVLYLPGIFFANRVLPLDIVVKEAHQRQIPVIVDAAGQLPPVSNLWFFTKECGADVAIFSGNKAIKAPSGTGVVVGRANLVETICRHAYPRHGIGRGMKVGKEELMAFLVALEQFISGEPGLSSELERCERVLLGWKDSLELRDGMTVSIEMPRDSGDPIPRLRISFSGGPHGGIGSQVSHLLRSGYPSIAVSSPSNKNEIAITPITLKTGEAEIVISRLREILDELRL